MSAWSADARDIPCTDAVIGMVESIFGVVKRDGGQNSLLWVFDALERDPGYLRKRMFGCEAAYLDDLLCLVVADKGGAWDGLLVCTAKEQHAELIQDMPALRPHSVLGKWLYVPQDDATFEETAEKLTSLVLAHDPRIGVAPKPRKPRRKNALPK